MSKLLQKQNRQIKKKSVVVPFNLPSRSPEKMMKNQPQMVQKSSGHKERGKNTRSSPKKHTHQKSLQFRTDISAHHPPKKNRTTPSQLCHVTQVSCQKCFEPKTTSDGRRRVRNSLGFSFIFGVVDFFLGGFPTFSFSVV